MKPSIKIPAAIKANLKATLDTPSKHHPVMVSRQTSSRAKKGGRQGHIGKKTDT